MGRVTGFAQRKEHNELAEKLLKQGTRQNLANLESYVCCKDGGPQDQKERQHLDCEDHMHLILETTLWQLVLFVF